MLTNTATISTTTTTTTTVAWWGTGWPVRSLQVGLVYTSHSPT